MTSRDELATQLESLRHGLGLPQLSVRILAGNAPIMSYDSPGARVEGTSYQVGSLTKIVTALAVLTLQREGVLQLRDPIAAHLPWFADSERGASGEVARVVDLLLHTSGLPRGAFYRDDPALDELRRAVRQRSSHPRGAFKYSNLGYALLGALIEQVTGDRYASVVERTVLAPFGLGGSGFGAPKAETRMTPPYRLRYFFESSQSPYDREAMALCSGPFASHGMYSTPADFCELLGRLLDAASRDVCAALLRLRHAIGPHLAAGCGFYFADTAHGEALFENAEHFGHSASMYLLPSQRFAVVAMANRGSAGRDLARIVEALVRFHLNGDLAALTRPYEHRRSVIGDYRDDRGSVLSVAEVGPGLGAAFDGDELRPLLHAGGDCFLMSGGKYARYVLRIDRQGAVVPGLAVGPLYFARGRAEPAGSTTTRHDDVVGIYRNASVGRIALFERNSRLILAFSPFKEARLERADHGVFVQKDGPFVGEPVRFAAGGRGLTLGELDFEKTDARY